MDCIICRKSGWCSRKNLRFVCRKIYNLKSLTVGTTEEEDTSRITSVTMCDDITFEQIKKQLNRMVEVIKVMDLTNVPIL